MSKLRFFTLAYFFLLLSIFSLEARRNTYQLNISTNDFGLHPADYTCTYNDVARQVRCVPNPSNRYATDRYFFPDVYVKKLTSDPTGVGKIGSYPNPNFNPGLPSEYTSTHSIFPFVVYTSKY